MPAQPYIAILIIEISICFLFLRSAILSQQPEPVMKVWSCDPLTRVQPETPPESRSSIELAGARNETESFQVVVSATHKKLDPVSASMSELTDGRGNRIVVSSIRLYREEYVYVRNPSPYSNEPPGWWPDALIPFINPYDGKPISPMRFNREEDRGSVSYKLSGSRFSGNNFTVWPGKNQPLWIDIAIPGSAVAGTYTGNFVVTSEQGGKEDLPVKLVVWDFSLPSQLSLTLAFGNLAGVAAKHGFRDGSKEGLEIQEHYAATLEEHRIAAPIPQQLYPKVHVNGSIDWKDSHSGLKRYLQAHNTGPFLIPSFPHPDLSAQGKKVLIRYLRSFFGYLKANGWAKNAYYFPIPEPNSKEAYDRVRAYAQVVHEAEPSIRFLCTEQPYSQDSSWGDLHGAVNIWCPLFSFFDEESARAALEQGEEVWTYTALCQKAPPYHPQFARVSGQPSLFWQIDFPLLHYRLPLWLNWKYSVHGLLYWSTVHWKNPERDVYTDPAFRNRYNGEGYLLYPGSEVGIPGPITSLRIKAIRDGLEDYAYFLLLSQRNDDDFVRKEIEKVATSWWKFTEAPSSLYEVRMNLAKRIQTLPGSLSPTH